MTARSDEIRDQLAESIGRVFLWLADTLGFLAGKLPWVILVAVVIWLLWRLSVLFGDHKLCWYCRGKGYKKALLGGVRVCPTCGGKGIRPRLGSGKH